MDGLMDDWLSVHFCKLADILNNPDLKEGLEKGRDEEDNNDC